MPSPSWLCRSLHRERGLKLYTINGNEDDPESLPSPGAWIETERGLPRVIILCSRSLHRERGLKPEP